ncbi:hypothetical protein [Rhodobium gokarnense]|uniref:Uncharacterized protein n=1 Tax=Rhodobium gokarnense TaxID=364296 RepID=A0ABT3H7V0_9HYPH|nr:hypothetical protein [Rhodobium gokarnense]MCW2306461.1 hypothetical protein [Rhodobium gokarnense]
MLRFTAPDGSAAEIDPLAVIRIRRTLQGEHAAANCRIDWGIMNLVTEAPNDVAAKVGETLTSLVVVTGGGNTPIWVNAKRVAGPYPPIPSMAPYGYRSSITLLGYRQHLVETQADVRRLLETARNR